MNIDLTNEQWQRLRQVANRLKFGEDITNDELNLNELCEVIEILGFDINN